MLSEADALFVEEDYDGAVAAYSDVLEVDRSNVRALVHRSIVYSKQGRFEDAIGDADRALELDSRSAQAHHRRGIACFHLGDFSSACASFTAATALQPSRTINMWMRKARAELEATGAPDGAGVAAVVAPPPPVVEPVGTEAEPAPAISSQPAGAAAALKKIRHEWYQTESQVVLAIFMKKLKRENCEISFDTRTVDIALQLPGDSEFQCMLDLAGSIVPEKCRIKVLTTKVEIKMEKAKTGVKWVALTSEGGDMDADGQQTMAAAVSNSAPAYPTSNKKQIDWDQLDKEVSEELEGEKLEGDAALNKLFKDIYDRADEDTRRAMNKSMQTSGGTCLSTNWGEVKEKDYEKDQVAPKGMEWKKYPK